MNFASKIGKFYIEHKSMSEEAVEESSDSSSKEDISVMEKEMSNDKVVPANIFQCIDEMQQDFPLLHSLRIDKTYQINSLIQEIVKLKSDVGVIHYTQKNNCSGCLLQVPSIRCSSGYKLELLKGGNFVEAAVKMISSNSAECAEGEAAECLLEALFKSYK
jgi:hypothetical protein